MAKTEVVTLDLNFQGKTQAIASYLIKHSDWRDLNRMRTRLDSSRAASGTQSQWLFRI